MKTMRRAGFVDMREKTVSTTLSTMQLRTRAIC